MPASMDQEPYRVEARVELTKPPGARLSRRLAEVDSGNLADPAGVRRTLFYRHRSRGIKRQQLQLANASGMQGLLTQLLSEKVTQTDARAAASTLAALQDRGGGPARHRAG